LRKFPEAKHALPNPLLAREREWVRLKLDSHDEVMVLVQACSVMNCPNVTTSEIQHQPRLIKNAWQKTNNPFFLQNLAAFRG
jgi:hypothetical protein